MALVYCVEDDENIRELVGYALRSQNFEVETFSKPTLFWKALSAKTPSLILLDIMLPEEDGLTILKKIRKQQAFSGIPVIMLTAKVSEYDVVRGLDQGADDYISKPFGIVELISRIKAVLRRSEKNPKKEAEFTFENVYLNVARHEVLVDSEPCQLTVKEFELLQYLLRNADLVLTREQIMEAVWGFAFEGESRTIDMHIRSLRQKLGDGGHIIKTVRGIGYRIGGGV